MVLIVGRERVEVFAPHQAPPGTELPRLCGPKVRAGLDWLHYLVVALIGSQEGLEARHLLELALACAAQHRALLRVLLEYGRLQRYLQGNGTVLVN